MGIPFFQCLGNHDMDYNLGGDETSGNTSNNFTAPLTINSNAAKSNMLCWMMCATWVAT
jgi:hypothetical protein